MFFPIHYLKQEAFIKALIVDDDLNACKGLSNLIPWQSLGFELVGAVQNGSMAMDLIGRESPDLILTDIMMPLMDGLELSRRINEEYIDIEIILLSAHEEFEYARKALNFGARGYLLKPINREKINKLTDDIRFAGTEIEERTSQYRQYTLTGVAADSLRSLLDSGNPDEIIGYLERSIEGLRNSGRELKRYCLSVVSFIFAYYNTLGISPDKIFQDRERLLSDLISRKRKEELVGNTLKIVYSFFTALNRRREEHLPQLVAQIENYISANYSDPELSLAEIADKFGISSAYLSTIFKEETGRNLSSHLIGIRMEKACGLLENPSLKLADICVKVGYRDSHYFGKAFKRIMKMTPSAYRNLRMSGNMI